MSRGLKITFAVAGVAAAILAAIAIFGYFSITKSLPDYAEPIELQNLASEVTVYRDDFGVPHIFADNSKDLFRTAGYVTAQDRLWQMDLTRRAANGELSEIFGERVLQNDIFFRTWGFRRIARSVVDGLNPQSKLALEAYAEGVNAFIEQNRDKLPIEFSLLGYKPAKWRVTDSIAYSRLLAFSLSFSGHIEPTLYRMAQKVGFENALELFPEYPQEAPVIAARELDAFAPLMAEIADRFHVARNTPGAHLSAAVSNSWVVNGGKSMSGKPILANDPHLDLRLPSVWYEMHWRSEDFNVSGMMLPGVPAILIGRNDAAAWGLTNGMIDDADFYLERISKDDPNKYWDGEQWQNFILVRDTIRVKGRQDPIFMDTRLKQDGMPIITETLSLFKNDTLAISARWTGFRAADDLDNILNINKAKNWDDFLAALEDYIVPVQNFIYADTSGTIAYTAAGSIPLRRDGNGAFFYKGWEKAGDWIGKIPFDEMPRVKNPPSGYIGTANNKMVGDDYPYYLGNLWEPDSRIRRIHQALSGEKTFSPADMKALQMDTRSLHAQRVVQKIRPMIEQAQLSDYEKSIWVLLSEWDFYEDAERPEATVYNNFFITLLQTALLDEMGEEIFEAYTFWSNMAIRSIEHLLDTPSSFWWDDKRTPDRKETAGDIVAKSFKMTIQRLQKELGDGPGFWDWGHVHKLTFKHPVGEQEPLDRIFNLGPFPIGGSPNSLAKAEYKLTLPYEVYAGASMRMVVDLADPQNAWTVIPGGQSGQPWSVHYGDQVDLWRAGKYKLSTLRQSILDRSAKHIQTAASH